MGGLDCIRRFPNAHFHRRLCPLASPPPPSSSPPGKPSSYSLPHQTPQPEQSTPKMPTSFLLLPQNQKTQQQKQQNDDDDDDDDKAEEQEEGEDENRAQGRGRGNWTIVLSSSLVGLLTGIGVILFNYSRVVYGRYVEAVILVPASGDLIVAILNLLRDALEDGSQHNNGNEQGGEKGENLLVKMGMPVWVFDGHKAASRPFFKAIAACVTLGTGNSLGPEGPSVEIGTSVAKGIGAVLDKNSQRKLSLVAAGSAAGIASGFNAAVSGCFFAVESVLWPSPPDSSSISLANTTSMVILIAVIASVVSEVGLGSEPAFKVSYYDFCSPTHVFKLLFTSVLRGLVLLTLSKCTSYMLVFVYNLHKTVGLPKFLFPIVGGLAIGLMALAYPEILYRGFENVDIFLEYRPLEKGLSADLLLQLVVAKIGATSLCRASRLVGGYYAPSLFIVAQSNPILHLSALEVASRQAYGLFGMGATLAGVCQVPLTAVLLFFELTQDYRIVLPLLGAVGLSSWITSGQTRRKGNTSSIQLPEVLSTTANGISSSGTSAERTSNARDLCEIESSLCIDGSDTDTEQSEKRIIVSEAVRTKYMTVLMDTLLADTVSLMLAEKQPCAHDLSQMCSWDGKVCRVPWTAASTMTLNKESAPHWRTTAPGLKNSITFPMMGLNK
ncbi:unnamed protein product [Malus baccata var. baccata]